MKNHPKMLSSYAHLLLTLFQILLDEEEFAVFHLHSLLKVHFQQVVGFGALYYLIDLPIAEEAKRKRLLPHSRTIDQSQLPFFEHRLPFREKAVTDRDLAELPLYDQ